MRTYWALGATLLLLLVTLGSVWSIAHAAPSTAALAAPHSAPQFAPQSAPPAAPLPAPPAAPAAEPAMSHAALPQAAAPAQRGEPSTCTGYDRETGLDLQSRTVEPNDILDCHTSTVSLTVGADCDKVPLHVVLDIDRSGSMVGRPIEEVKAAARALIQALDMSDPKNTHIKIGLVSHGDPASIDSQLTDRAGQISGRVGNMRAGGEDNLSDSIAKSNSVLRIGRRGDIAPFEVAVILSDGGQTYPPNRGVQAAGRLKGDGVLVIAICADNGTAGGCQAMRQIASSGRYYFEARGTSGLNRIFTDIAEYVSEISMRTMIVEETLPEGLELVPDSVVPEPMDIDIDDGPAKIRWQFNFPRITETMGYEVKPSAITTYTLAENKTTFRDSQDRAGDLIVPTAVLTVSGPCFQTPTPSNTPTNTPTATPTNTPGPTDTPTPTPTNTPTITPSPTPVPLPLYLPILNPWRCIVRDRPTDIALVIDASTSMRQSTSAGRPKIEAAQAGARVFIKQMREVDRTSIIEFNNRAQVLARLTNDLGALDRAIDAIRTDEWTRIDLALLAAADELASVADRAEHTQVIVLMTDGHPSQTTPDAVRAAADVAREPGTAIFVIAVGPDVNTELMIDVAGEASRFYHVEDAEALAEIYEQIAHRIPCVPPPGWVRPISAPPSRVR